MRLSLRRLARPVVLSLSAFFVLGGASHAQTRTREGASAVNQRAIERRVRAFYAFWGKDGDGMENRTLMRSYTSRRLNRWLYSSAYREYGADYFFQAQDYDNDWGRARVSNVRVRGNAARLSATLGSPQIKGKTMGPRKLRLKMIKENGLWKIDTVDPVDG